VRRTIRLTLVVLALVALVLGVQQYRLGQARKERDRAELEAGLAASRVLSATFERAGALRAARLSGRVMSQGSCVSGYLFTDQQRTVAPYSVNYMVDLSHVGRGSFRWDGKRRVLLVEVPGVTVEPPSVDMTAAKSEQSGVIVSRACGLAMQNQVAGRLSAAAAERAGRPDYLERARTSARVELGSLVQSSLAAAGLGHVEVRVLLATDPRVNGERWDVSRSIDDVLHNRY
jgi:hypothetical protein